MSDLVLGITKPLVLGTVNRAQSAYEEEARLWRSMQSDLEYITGEFQVMHHVVSGTTTQATVVSPLVTQVHDLAVDIEDGVEFVIHLDTKSNWLLRVMPRFMRPSLPLDKAVDIIEELKARVRDLSRRIQCYKLITPRYEQLITDSVSNSGKETNHPAVEAGFYNARQQRDMEALTKLITEDKSSELRVISLWAPGGDLAGAASIIKRAYDNSKSWGRFELQAWVKLVRPFNIRGFIDSLLDQYNTYIRQVQQRDEQVYLNKNELLHEANRKPYLLVLEDDASITQEEWATILKYLPDNNESRIIVSTGQIRTARLCTGSPCFQRFSADLSLCVFFKEGPLIGRMAEANQLRCLMAKAHVKGSQVISVWGIPGVGKSALVRNLYREKLQTKEFRRHIWMDVSYPFSLKDFCSSLLLQFRPESLEAYEDPVTACQDLLKYNQCLLVVDNLQSTADWILMRDALLAFRPSESLIVVITNEERTALFCADDREDLVFNVKALQGGEAVDLFQKRVKMNTGMDSLLTGLVSKCGGLPKVIVAVSDSLIEAFDWMERAEILNDQFTYKLETRSEFGCLHDLLVWLHSYIRACPKFLKSCIFYLSIFLRSQMTRRRRLVMRWVAEGYPEEKTSDSAEDHFTRISKLSMIQPAEQTIITDDIIRMVWCRVNPFFQEYITSRTNEGSLALEWEVCELEGRSRQTTVRTARHIVIQESWQRDKIAFERILSEKLANGKFSISRLHSLTVFGEWKTYFISKRMTAVRVLDLENASGVTDEDLRLIMKLLPGLKFLSLRGCRAIKNLPNSVSHLGQLQTLDLRYTSVVTLPESIKYLKNLQYLRAGTSVRPEVSNKLNKLLKPVGVKVSSRVEKLTMLHTLGVVDVGSDGGKDTLKEIKNLTHLCKLGVFGINKKNIEVFYSAISDHLHLQSLSVEFKKDDCKATPKIMQENVVPPKELKSLKLYRLANKLPVWINHEKLCNLRKMNLEIDTLSEHDIAAIGLLPELCILRLRVTPPTDGKLNFRRISSGSGLEVRFYKKVKILEIACGSRSLDVTFGKGSLQNLEVLKAGSHIRSVQFEEQKKLREVYIVGSNGNTLKRHLEEELSGHPCKPRVVNVTLAWTDQHYSFPFYPTTTQRPM